ncbi:MAG TPA: c-type cytochrome domain-containing protein, partial [Verrucomicrobiae bacterium]|nr:c-type cytochrome domain-containing protein [Verrucomicrobiae bacterium]
MTPLVSYLLLSSLLFGACAAGAQDAKPVSYYRDIVPILKRSCTGCHHPGKLKADLDLTTYATFQKGGKHGQSWAPGKPDESRVVEEISGEEP